MEPDDEAEHEVNGIQVEHVDISSVTQETPLLDVPLIAPIEIVARRVEHASMGHPLMRCQ